MQLIETEASVDIKKKMSAVEDQVSEKFEVNKPLEITNGYTDSIDNSDNESLKAINEVTTTQSIEDITKCNENGILKTEASKMVTIRESNGKVEHTPCMFAVGDQPMTVSNDIPDTTNPKLIDPCNKDINKDLSNIVNSITNEKMALNDSSDSSLVFDNEDEALKTNGDTQAAINKEDCKDEGIIKNIEFETLNTLESEEMETDCPLESSAHNITDENVSNDTNLDSKKPMLSTVIYPIVTDLADSEDQPMEIENDIVAIESDLMEVQLVNTTMGSVAKTKVVQEITECEVNKNDIVEAAVSEKILIVKDLVKKPDIIANMVEPRTTVESSSAPSDMEKSTDESNKPIENHCINMSEPTPIAIEEQEAPAKATETVDNINSEKDKITTDESNKPTVNHGIDMSEPPPMAIEEQEKPAEATKTVDNIENEKAKITTNENIKPIENHAINVSEPTPMAFGEQEKLAEATETDDNIGSEKATVNETPIENSIEMKTEKDSKKISANHSEETKANDTELLLLQSSNEDTQPKSIDTEIIENKTVKIPAKNLEETEDNNTESRPSESLDENTQHESITTKIIENKTVDNLAPVVKDNFDITAVGSPKNNTAESSSKSKTENTTIVQHVVTSEKKTVNTIASEIVDISENKTASKLVDSSETKNIDNCKANNEEIFESKTEKIPETSNKVSSIKESEIVLEKVVPETKSTDLNAEIVDEQSDDACVIVETDDKNELPIEIMDVEDSEATETPDNKCKGTELKELTEIITLNKQEPEIIDLDKDTEQKETKKPEPAVKSTKRTISGLSNTLDILSDDDDDDDSTKVKLLDPFDKRLQSNDENSNDKNESLQTDNNINQAKDNTNETSKHNDKCISLDDDDDVMLIDEDSQDDKTNADNKVDSPAEKKDEAKVDEKMEIKEDLPQSPKADKNADAVETKTEESPTVIETPKTLIPDNFMKTTKKAIADMTREDLEEFCLEKIADAVIERNNLGEIKTKLKQMLQNVEEWRNKSMILTKQNRDLQIVLKAIEEEMKKRTNAPIKPLKISRSVGMQVLITETDKTQKKRSQTSKSNATTSNSSVKSNKQTNNQSIPVPILVPANGRSPAKPISQMKQNSTTAKNPNISNTKSPITNSINKPAEKRPLSVDSACVDLTDDEPPPKQQVTAKNSVQAPVRVVAQHQLMAQRPAFTQAMQGPRKVYIPINSNGPRPGHIVRGVTVSNNLGPRPHMGTNVVRVSNPNNITQTRMLTKVRHPAPLPTITRQPTSPGWKAIPPPPDLKISKVENGIVISWKIEGYQEDSFEEIASYQLFAYQETQSPPSTMLWKKIGDVKALPLPMACTLTQFMAGYKYYFAVRAVDVKKRIGSFSLPGSILLLTGP